VTRVVAVLLVLALPAPREAEELDELAGFVPTTSATVDAWIERMRKLDLRRTIPTGSSGCSTSRRGGGDDRERRHRARAG
jgi:hypothetical protein